jgi:hypothetical protein
MNDNTNTTTDQPVESGAPDQPVAAPSAPAQPVPGTVIESWVDAYRAAPDNKARHAVRKQVEAARDAATMADDLPLAKNLIATLDALTVRTAPAKADVDPFDVLTGRVQTLLYAAYLLASGVEHPDGIDADKIDLFAPDVDAETGSELDTPRNRLIAVSSRMWDAMQATSGFATRDMSDDTRSAATKLASAKITRSGDRNPIAEVIVRAFEGLDVGTVLKVSEVARRGALGDYRPSGGAIVAHLEGKSPVAGYSLTAHESGVKGVRID